PPLAGRVAGYVQSCGSRKKIGANRRRRHGSLHHRRWGGRCPYPERLVIPVYFSWICGNRSFYGVISSTYQTAASIPGTRGASGNTSWTDMDTATAASGRQVADEVAERIERLIMDGVLKAGQALPSERRLTEKLGVSRTALREGLKLLRARHHPYRARQGLVCGAHLASGRRPAGAPVPLAAAHPVRPAGGARPARRRIGAAGRHPRHRGRFHPDPPPLRGND